MTTQTTDLIGRVTPHSEGAEVEGGKDGRQPHSFPGNLWKAYHLWEETVQMDRVNEVHSFQTRWEFLRKVADQGKPGETLGQS